eukprot:TRINITY_DN58365_c0_g1_i1.p2 TRINITY_DN58365_c0_g1~~TRINITY_DN58365_c0_g1_i1.p2  ORF type:complete len:377 (+),score=33.73 TRINITY_DN58365_c0_g1_i1:49-1179(+)
MSLPSSPSSSSTSLSSSVLQDATEMLIEAAIDGNVSEVKWLVEQVPLSPAYVTEYPHTADCRTVLLLAVENNQTEVAQWLLSSGGCSALEQDEFGNTPLLIAAQNGNFQLVEWLCCQEAPTGLLGRAFANIRGVTPLLAAAANGSLEVVTFLLENEYALLSESDQFGWDAFLWAISNSHIEVMEYLVTYHGVSVSSYHNHEHLPATHAAHYQAPRALKWLVEAGANPQQEDDRGLSALSWAIMHADLETVKWLLLDGWWLWNTKTHQRTVLQLDKSAAWERTESEEVDFLLPDRQGNPNMELWKGLQAAGWELQFEDLPPQPWTIQQHNTFPPVFQFFCGVALWCLGKKAFPSDLLVCMFGHWDSCTFSPRLQFLR